MSSDLQPIVKWLRYGTKTHELNTIKYSNQGGWYYRPGSRTAELGAASGVALDEPTFGRGSTGMQEAKGFMADQLRRLLNLYANRMPDEIDNPAQFNLEHAWYGNYTHDPKMHAGFTHPVLGEVIASVIFAGQTIYYEVRAHNLLAWLADGLTLNVTARPGTAQPLVHQVINAADVAKFRRDPFWNLRGVREILNPPKAFFNQEFLGTRQKKPETTEPWSFSEKHADFFENPERIGNAIVESIPAMQRLFAAFQFLGIKVTAEWKQSKQWDPETQTFADFTYAFHTGRAGEQQTVAQKLVIELPTIPGVRGSEEAHTLTFTEGGLGITCGYAASQMRHEQWQRRQDEQMLLELTRDLEELESTDTISFPKYQKPKKGDK